MIYLDNSATTRAFEAVTERMCCCMRDSYYNPAAAYGPAVALERDVNAARMNLAKLAGHPEGEIVYTSGGTESNNMAILGSLSATRGKKRIVTSMAEHPSVYGVIKKLADEGAAEAVFLDTTRTGEIDVDCLSNALTGDTTFVSLMHVNNETGAITNIAAAYARIRRLAPNAYFHVDGVQAFMKLPQTCLPCDFYSISGHKFHAPKGVGALYLRKGIKFSGGQIGGGQEGGLRSGTLNAPGVLGMDAALLQYAKNQAQYISAMRAAKLRLAENLCTLPDVAVNGPAPEDGAPHILNLSFLGVRGEVLLHALEAKGVLVSTGSACSAHKKGRNRILTSLGLPASRQESAIRFSLSPLNTAAEMDEASNIIAEQVAFLRRYQRR